MNIALRLFLGFLYRLIFFPFFTASTVISAVANQVHWLVTGMTFEEAARRAQPSLAEEMKKHLYTRH